MTKWGCLFILVIASLGLSLRVSAAAPKLVRISIGKTTSKQAGDLGQPVTSYYANVDVGTPPKPFKFLLDVNAREIWIPHYMKLGLIYTRLNYKDGYAKKDSTTSLKENQEYSIDYDGTVLTGKAYKDQFEFKNVTESLVKVKYMQRFLAISSANNDGFTRHNVDGVLALNPFPLSETGSDLVTVGLSRANMTSQLKFSLLLDQDMDSDRGGELAFGAEDRTKYLGALRYHQVVPQHRWELNMQSVMLGGSVVSCLEGSCTALISTSRNDIYGPTKDVQLILKLLGVIKSEQDYKDNQLYEIDCLKVASSPPLTFIIDGAYYTIHPLSYIRKKVDGLIFKSSTCYVSILGNGSQKNWELGTSFVSNYYAVFDVNSRQVAFGVRT